VGIHHIAHNAEGDHEHEPIDLDENYRKLSMGVVAPGTPEFLASVAEGRNPGIAHLLRYFSWSHLPEHLQPISGRMAETAVRMVLNLPDGPELTAGLRKLLEAKDCFVRAALDKVD